MSVMVSGLKTLYVTDTEELTKAANEGCEIVVDPHQLEEMNDEVRRNRAALTSNQSAQDGTLKGWGKFIHVILCQHTRSDSEHTRESKVRRSTIAKTQAQIKKIEKLVEKMVRKSKIARIRLSNKGKGRDLVVGRVNVKYRVIFPNT